MSLPLAQIFCGKPTSITPSHSPSIRQPITDGTFIFPLIQPKHPSEQDAETLQRPHGSSSALLFSLQHQAQILQAIHKTIQQFHQHLKGEQLDRRTIQIIVLQLQNEFASLRNLLLSSVGTTPIIDTSVNNSAFSPPFNPNCTSTALPILSADEPSVRCSSPEGAAGPTRMKTNNSANTDLQSSPNKREASLTTMHNLTSRISKLKNVFTDEIATYTSITAGHHSRYFFI